MKILADLHHSDLFYSLQLLFEKRLGYELYRPIGLDWYHQGYWHVYPHINTAQQYLATDQAQWAPKDVHGELLPPSAVLNKNYRYEDGIYYVSDPTKNGIVNRGIILDKFKSMEFDILISSIPAHIGPFNSLIAQFQPKAKHIFQVGNAWSHQPGIKNILASTGSFPFTPGTNICFYHQEFDLDVFYNEPPIIKNVVSSYIHYMKSKEIMNQCAARLPAWKFTSYGAGMEDHIMETHLIADNMRKSAFIWHFKPEGDGFGYCYSQDTEVLSDKGWKLFCDLQSKDKVATFNQDTGELEYQTPTEFQSYFYEGEMCHFQGKTVDLLVTPNHRMWVERYDKNAKSKGWRFEVAEKMDYMKAYYPSRAAGFKLAADHWEGEDCGVSKEYARFLGWYLAEGCISVNTNIVSKKTGEPTGHTIHIPNTNLQYLREIKQLAKNLGYTNSSFTKPQTKNGFNLFRKDGTHCPRKKCYQLRIGSKDLYNKLIQFGKCDEKFIPEEILKSNKEILWNFFEPFFLGDGCIEGVQSTLVSTNITSKLLIDQLQEIAIKLGLRSHITYKKTSPIGKKSVWRLRVTLDLSNKYKHLTSKKKLYNSYNKTFYKGMVYCVTVPNSLLFTRRNGIPVVSGNSIHEAFAVGRPAIVWGNQYRGKLASQLFNHMDTCIDVSQLGLNQLPQVLHAISSTKGWHERMCKSAADRFKQVVNYDKEELEIRKFLERLV